MEKGEISIMGTCCLADVGLLVFRITSAYTRILLICFNYLKAFLNPLNVFLNL